MAEWTKPWVVVVVVVGGSRMCGNMDSRMYGFPHLSGR